MRTLGLKRNFKETRNQLRSQRREQNITMNPSFLFAKVSMRQTLVKVKTGLTISVYLLLINWERKEVLLQRNLDLEAHRNRIERQ